MTPNGAPRAQSWASEPPSPFISLLYLNSLWTENGDIRSASLDMNMPSKLVSHCYFLFIVHSFKQTNKCAVLTIC